MSSDDTDGWVSLGVSPDGWSMSATLNPDTDEVEWHHTNYRDGEPVESFRIDAPDQSMAELVELARKHFGIGGSCDCGPGTLYYGGPVDPA